jgi:hypothetical protein
MKLTKETEQGFINLLEERGVQLEGNIVKLLEPQSDSFKEYIENAIKADKEARRQRLKITRQVQQQNKDLENKTILLEEKAAENESLMQEIKQALVKAEEAQKHALEDLDLLQRKTQFELIGNIVKVALWVIMAVGITTTILYIVALFAKGSGPDTTLIGNTWSNLLGILLTNSFSIIGTIMGVKYASESGSDKQKEK